jgi:hypothetical protein
VYLDDVGESLGWLRHLGRHQPVNQVQLTRRGMLQLCAQFYSYLRAIRPGPSDGSGFFLLERFEIFEPQGGIFYV